MSSRQRDEVFLKFIIGTADSFQRSIAGVLLRGNNEVDSTNVLRKLKRNATNINFRKLLEYHDNFCCYSRSGRCRVGESGIFESFTCLWFFWPVTVLSESPWQGDVQYRTSDAPKALLVDLSATFLPSRALVAVRESGYKSREALPKEFERVSLHEHHVVVFEFHAVRTFIYPSPSWYIRVVYASLHSNTHKCRS